MRLIVITLLLLAGIQTAVNADPYKYWPVQQDGNCPLCVGSNWSGGVDGPKDSGCGTDPQYRGYLGAAEPNYMRQGGWPIPEIGLYGSTRAHGPHNGLDISANIGDAVIAPADGVVTYINMTTTNPKFNEYYPVKKIWLTHPDGTTTIYNHLSAINVARDQPVKAGTKIGETGISQNAAIYCGDTSLVVRSGPHLHFAVSNVTYAASDGDIDPLTKVPLGAPPSGHTSCILNKDANQIKCYQYFTWIKNSLNGEISNAVFPEGGVCEFSFLFNSSTIVQRGDYTITNPQGQQIDGGSFNLEIDPTQYPDSSIFHYLPQTGGVFLSTELIRSPIKATYDPDPSVNAIDGTKFIGSTNFKSSDFENNPQALVGFVLNDADFPLGQYTINVKLTNRGEASPSAEFRQRFNLTSPDATIVLQYPSPGLTFFDLTGNQFYAQFKFSAPC